MNDQNTKINQYTKILSEIIDSFPEHYAVCHNMWEITTEYYYGKVSYTINCKNFSGLVKKSFGGFKTYESAQDKLLRLLKESIKSYRQEFSSVALRDDDGFISDISKKILKITNEIRNEL